MRHVLDRLVGAAELVLLAASAVVLGAAYVFQYGFDLPPCELCYLQRYPYMAVIGLMVVGWVALRLGRGLTWLLALAGLALIVNAGIAVNHVGVEQKWWEGPATCSAVATPADSEQLLDQILNAPLVRCDEVSWSFLGVSMAGYNLLIALILTVFAFYAWRQRSRT